MFLRRNGRKYPLSVFIMGIIFKLVIDKRGRLLLGLTVLLFILRVFINGIHIIFPLMLLTVWLVAAIVSMLHDVKIVLTMEDNGKGVSIDKMFADNDKGYRNAVDTVNEYISAKKNDDNNSTE